MMKTAFAYWDNRIAPLFDTARHIDVVETESGRIIRETQELLADGPPLLDESPEIEAAYN